MARLVQAGRADARPHAARQAVDLLMALGLAAMLWPLGDPIPPPAGEVGFGLVVAWSLVLGLGARGTGPRVADLVRAGAGNEEARRDLLEEHRRAVLARLEETRRNLWAIERKIDLYRERSAS